ncbi:MAG: DNA-directed RNA polymerase subunit alpha, partial [Minisyncoccia bacterium]
MIPLPHKIQFIEKDKDTAQIEIEGLYPGYGITLGNTLRRVLLSSLEGCAITSFKIKGVSHEFTTLPGVLEDVVIISLNLKKLRFKMQDDEPQIITLSVKGKGKVTGKDIKTTPQIEVVNKDQLIATLTDEKARLEMEIKVEKGVGYLPIEMREEKTKVIGEIPIDAIFTPIKKVSYKIENVRVGKRTDFEKLILSIETDGTLNPKEAYAKSLNIIIEQFSYLLNNLDKK